MRAMKTSSLCIGIGILAWCAAAGATGVTPAEMDEAGRWVAAKFKGVVLAEAPAAGLEVLANNDPVQPNARGGRPLRIVDKEYRRGLYCHATSRVVVRLPGPGKLFTAVAGVDSNDQTSGGRGSVDFSVRVADKEAFRSGLMREGMAGAAVEVDLKGEREFTLEIGDGGDGITCDQADWADARVVLTDGKEVWLGDLPILGQSRRPLTTEPPFSFTYEGRPSRELLAGWPVERASRKLDEHRSEHVATWTDPKSGLSVRCVAIEYHDYPTVEWTLYFRNGGTADTPILEQILAVDTEFSGSVQGDPVLRYHTGDMCTADSYAPHAEPMAARSDKRIANVGGRPTHTAFPYFNLGWPGEGTLVVLSWAGQWSMQFARDDTNGLRVRGGQELTHFRLHAGEQVRGPMAVVQFYKGDWLRAQNVWRRWMIAHNLPRPGGKLVQPMASLCTGNYYPGLMSNAAQELRFLREHVEQGVRFDAWWQDAGWYPCDGVTWPKTGTWEVDAGRFPKGLREVSDYVHAQGARSIVWFEPERVHAGTWLAEQRPEWVHGGKAGGLLKLGDDACRAWLIEHIDRLLTEQAIDIYRQDFNIDPLAYWRAADAPDRQGITEIRHVEGYFAYWDELLRRRPDMLIDSCASGGRRNDLETLRRAVPLLRSDWYNAPDGQQCHTAALSLWFPFQGTAGCLYRVMNDKYWIRSNMTAEFTFGPESSGLAGADWGLLKSMMAEWRQINGCFYGDFYPLTPYSLDDDVWMAWQYDVPESGKGVVQVFRRGGCIYEKARLPLHGLDPNAVYRVQRFESNESPRVSGRELTERGLPVELTGRPDSAIYTYQLER